MLRIVMDVDRPVGQAIGIKEALAMDLERYGDVRVVSVEEITTWKQEVIERGFLQECQTCGEIYSMHGGNAGKSWNYCPNCGAKMDGGGEDG